MTEGGGAASAAPLFLRELPVEAFRLSRRASNCLRNAGYRTIGQVADATDDDLMAISNFGRGSLDDVHGLLRSLGIPIVGPAAPSPKPANYVDPRRPLMLKRMLAGETYEEIATPYGITRERVRQIIDPTPEQRAQARAAKRGRRYRKYEQHYEAVRLLLREGKSIAEVHDQTPVPWDYIAEVLNTLPLADQYERKAGGSLAREPRMTKYGRDGYLDAIRKVAEIEGTDTCSSIAFRRVREARPDLDLPSLALSRRYFRSWNEAVEAAGLRTFQRTPGSGPRTYSDEDYVNALRAIWERGGKGLLSISAYSRLRRPDEPSLPSMRNRFGRWHDALATIICMDCGGTGMVVSNALSTKETCEKCSGTGEAAG